MKKVLIAVLRAIRQHHLLSISDCKSHFFCDPTSDFSSFAAAEFYFSNNITRLKRGIPFTIRTWYTTTLFISWRFSSVVLHHEYLCFCIGACRQILLCCQRRAHDSFWSGDVTSTYSFISILYGFFIESLWVKDRWPLSFLFESL